MRGRKRQTHCNNGHPLAGDRICRPCRKMRAKRHRVNDTAVAEKVRAYKRAWRARQPKDPKPRVPPPRSPQLAVCKRGHDRTDPANLTKRNECKACRRFVWKFWWAGEPLPDRSGRAA